MADLLSGLFVASLLLALIGVVVFVNALLTQGLRWVGRRLATTWRARARRVSHDRDPATAEGEPARGGGPTERRLLAR